MPACICTKDFNVSEDDFRYSDGSRPSLRDMVLRATGDGDFQSADVSQGQLTIEAIVPRRDGHGQISRKRHFDLRSELFPSIADSIVAEDDVVFCEVEE